MHYFNFIFCLAKLSRLVHTHHQEDQQCNLQIKDWNDLPQAPMVLSRFKPREDHRCQRPTSNMILLNKPSNSMPGSKGYSKLSLSPVVGPCPY